MDAPKKATPEAGTARGEHHCPCKLWGFLPAHLQGEMLGRRQGHVSGMAQSVPTLWTWHTGLKMSRVNPSSVSWVN